MKRYFIFLLIGALPFINSCSKKDGGGLNIFSIQDDIELGLKTKEQIEASPTEFPVLDERNNQEAYKYLQEMRDDILATNTLKYKDDFEWGVYIIEDDNTLNAFCTPGGYIYIYTGLIKFLDDKSSLIGVLGHEMAHADQRHSTKLLTKTYGLQTLFDIILGKDQGALSNLALNLASLKFSRKEETDADLHSVIYLCPTKYYSDGAAHFFEKLNEIGSSNPPEFLSTHPNPENRIQNIKTKTEELKCSDTISEEENVSGYQQF